MHRFNKLGELFQVFYNKSVDLDSFILKADMYLNSKLRFLIDEGNFGYGIELRYYFGVVPIEPFAEWLGVFYSLAQWYSCLYSSEIVKLLPLREVIVYYNTFWNFDMISAIQRVFYRSNISFCF